MTLPQQVLSKIGASTYDAFKVTLDETNDLTQRLVHKSCIECIKFSYPQFLEIYRTNTLIFMGFELNITSCF